jgi:hypothetical protein
VKASIDNPEKDPEKEPEAVITYEIPCRKASHFHRRRTRVNKELSRKFAALERTEDAILGFANRYGRLGKIHMGYIVEPEEQDFEFVICERVTDWFSAIEDMRRAVELWDILRTADTQALAQLIKWSDTEQLVHYVSSVIENSFLDRMELIAWKDKFNSEDFDKFKPGYNILPAWYLLQRWINKGLTEGQELRAVWKDDILVFQSASNHLLPAMWKQLAEEVVSSEAGKPVTTAVCRFCGKEFSCERQSAMYCSDSCKMKLHRRGKKPATSQDSRTT